MFKAATVVNEFRHIFKGIFFKKFFCLAICNYLYGSIQLQVIAHSHLKKQIRKKKNPVPSIILLGMYWNSVIATLEHIRMCFQILTVYTRLTHLSVSCVDCSCKMIFSIDTLGHSGLMTEQILG